MKDMMHAINIETLQKEAIRLLDLEIEIFEELRNSKFVLICPRIDGHLFM